MTEKLVALQIKVRKAAEAGREAGQGSLEYIGAIVIAAIVVVAVTAAINAAKPGIGTSIAKAIKDIVG
jgi:hypothetical protein